MGLTYNIQGRERATFEIGTGWNIEVPVVLVCRNPDCPTNDSDLAKATGADGAK
jgi:hypothetical protein